MPVIPGRWEVFTLDSGTVVVRAREGDTQYNVAKVFSDGEGDYISTASLIAAAPDLLAALKKHMPWREEPVQGWGDWADAAAAIAKAEGRE